MTARATPDPPGRIAWIDVAKGAGILLVVFGHVWRGCANAGLAIDPAVYAAVDRAIYLFHMPLFFFLAGLVLDRSLRGRTLTGYARDRAEQLIVPLLVWSYISAAFRVLAGGAANRGDLPLRDILLYPFVANDIYWFLWALFLIQVALAAALRAPAAGRTAMIGLLVLSLAVVAAGLSIPVVGTALHDLPYLALGYAARTLACRRFGRGAGAAGVALFAGAEILALRLAPEGLPGLLTAAAAVIGFTVALAALHARFAQSALARGLAALGARSMPIYLAHVIALAGARTVALRLGITGLGPHLVVGCLAGVLMPLALYRLAGRLGWDAALGFARFRRRPTPSGLQGRAPALATWRARSSAR
ncbi:acyltransferase family protein [Methylobacterium sp. NEAU K]|uniref:acyltransferase family protein n=1 Tax=Methylobacterium sp. NEAU K TaxID=3064946 RepID=UPI0027339E34|nr:acyltransferase family protein [Methylobacterium sp. NEAU K]MDP4006126.1 acyltransferase family protein [Methylobacterium sp. NEAU K]